MKRKLFIILLFLSPLVLHAQWRIGVSGGADYNQYSINTNYQVDFRYEGAWGWSAAVFGQYNFLDWVGIRAELEATERNYRFHRTGVWSGTNYVLHNTYLQLPVMAQFSFGGQNLRGFVNAGCYAGYWLTGKYKGTVVDMINETTVPINEPYIFQNEKDQHWDFCWLSRLWPFSTFSLPPSSSSSRSKKSTPSQGSISSRPFTMPSIGQPSR